MRYTLSFFIFFTLTTTLFGQQNSVMNLGSSLSLNSSKKSTSEYLKNEFLMARKTPVIKYLEDQPDANFNTNDSRFNNQKNWTTNRKELRFSVGITQFLGDLGGKDQVGTDYSLKDLDLKSTNFMAMVGYRYRFSKLFATTTSLTLGMLRGDDALTTEKYRHARNLKFRAPILELSQRIDFMLYRKEKVGRRYNIRGLKGFKNRNEQVYAFAGVGLVYFAPEGQIVKGQMVGGQEAQTSSWYDLRSKSTEGQGLLGGIKKYSPITVCLPVGLGFRVGISREWRIGMEASYTKTFSDYLDDVHGVYYDNSLLAAQKGPIAAALADRSDKTNPDQLNWFATDQQRGDKQRDAYFFINVVVTRNITYRSYTKTHRRYKLSKGKYKF